MSTLKIDETIKLLFTKNKKCIVNADLDGLLSGMLLQHFLDWQIVGYSSCSGRKDDELWLINNNENLEECIFVDLPVFVKNYSTIDQHFILFDNDTYNQYLENNNKINPNVIRNRLFKNNAGQCEYTAKYPFGTIHFILAILENLNIIDKNYRFLFFNKIGNFDLADLILRADRVIGNTYSYTNNCLNWCDWLLNLGGINTQSLFVVVKKDYINRLGSQKAVENKLISLGCKGPDGDCSNLFRNKDYFKLKTYFSFLSYATNLKQLPVVPIFDFGKLEGERIDVNSFNFKIAKSQCNRNDIFSFAFVTMKTLSITYIKKDN